MTVSADRIEPPPHGPEGLQLLPTALLTLPVEHLPLPEPLAAGLRSAGARQVADLLALPRAVFQPGAWLGPSGADELRSALARVLDGGLARFTGPESPAAEAGAPRWRGLLLAQLTEADRELLRLAIGLDGPVVPPAELARRYALTTSALSARLDTIRTRLHERAPSLVLQLRQDLGRELRAFDGVLDGRHLTPGTLPQEIARDAGDPGLAMRLLAFCFPGDFWLHGDLLVALPEATFRRTLHLLRRLAVPHRLPQPVDALVGDLQAAGLPAPRGLVLHLLRQDLRIPLTSDPDLGEIASPDPRGLPHRLVDLLTELGQPTAFDDLVFAYRERHHRANPGRLRRRLRRDRAFLQVGPDTWSLRAWHQPAMQAVAPLADRLARHVVALGGRHHVADLLGADGSDPLTAWLVVDLLAADPRVRHLGRGDVCPATHARSSVLEQLLIDFRRAGGDVVLSRFLQNQPVHHRRLIARLLHENRLFTAPSPDRIDLLSNYPFNPERLQRLLALVDHHLTQRSGYASATALKVLVDRTDLGGAWLQPTLLADVLRRNGTFDVLPGGLIGQRRLGLGARLLRTVRQALREADEPVTLDEILRARPDLAEFAGCLSELLGTDPLVQTPDGCRYTLA